MTDRQLLKLAAKAADMPCPQFEATEWGKFWVSDHGFWNPLLDDGDAFRLAVKLKLSVKHGVDIFDETNTTSAYAYFGDVGECGFEPHGNDPYAATRRAIVRAAAEIGRSTIVPGVSPGSPAVPASA